MTYEIQHTSYLSYFRIKKSFNWLSCQIEAECCTLLEKNSTFWFIFATADEKLY